MVLDELEIRSIRGVHRAMTRKIPIRTRFAAPTPGPARDVSVRKRSIGASVMLFAGTVGSLVWTAGFLDPDYETGV